MSRSGVSRGVLVAHGEMPKRPKWHPFIGGDETASGRVATSTQKRMKRRAKGPAYEHANTSPLQSYQRGWGRSAAP